MRISKEKLATTATVVVALALSGAGLAGAQTLYNATGTNDTSTTSSSGTSGTINATSTPGIPNTGAGGNAGTDLTAIIVSAIAAVGGTYYLRRRSTAR